MPIAPVRKRDLVTALRGALREFRKFADDSTGPDLDVRLYVEPLDSNWWLSTGDVQFDTATADYCAAATLCVSMTPEETADVASDMLEDIANQVAEGDPS